MAVIVSKSFKTKPGDPIEGPGWLTRSTVPCTMCGEPMREVGPAKHKCAECGTVFEAFFGEGDHDGQR